MMTGKLSLVFGIFFIFNVTQTLKGQSPTYPIVFNEYCVSNTPTGYTDEKGVLNDYVELFNNHTSAINLTSFYLSNDRNNLAKWKFPSNYPQLQVATYAIIWLSGKNTNVGGNVHTNFTMEQCKNQWLILSNGSGVVYDSVFIQSTKAGHVRGRVDYDNIGSGAWKIFTTKSPGFANGAPSASNYAPTPKIFLSGTTNYTGTVNTGSFLTDATKNAIIVLENQQYDTASSCYDIFYTLNGHYPVPFYNGSDVFDTYYFKYADSLTAIPMQSTTIIRAIAVPKPNSTICPINTLPSFCETNTYFVDVEHNAFDTNFGVISLSLDRADTGWFNAQGTYAASVHVEYYDQKKQISEGYGMITRPIQEEWRTAQKGFYITKDDRLGSGCNFEGNIFNVEGLGTTTRTVFPALHLKGGDYESHSVISGSTGSASTESYGTGVRDVVMQSIAAKYNLNVSPLHIKPVIAFVNGKYWGVYDLREIYDRFYEEFYNGQAQTALDLNFVHTAQEGAVSYWDGPYPALGADFNAEVYNVVRTRPMTNGNDYNKVMANMDKASLIDYMILNSYGMNADLWGNNVALAKGGDKTKPGGKWHFYLWNMPSAFNYTNVTPTGNIIPSPSKSPCFLYNTVNSTFLYTPTLRAYNGMGNIMTKLMSSLQGNAGFQLEYKNRYQDLMNGPLSCVNIEKQFDFVYKLYSKEMKYHEDPGSTPFPGKFNSKIDNWDSNMVKLRKFISNRCFVLETGLNAKGCFGAAGPFNLSVDVQPTGAGQVKLNTTLLENYVWEGKYYQTNLSFKAIPINSDYVFHHWEFTGPSPIDGILSKDSVIVNFNTGGNVVAVFTDKRNGINNSDENANVPNGFTPNGDGINDIFRPLGSSEFVSEFEMTVWNRWGQEVFRSTDPLNGWDGKFKGQDAQSGVYAYIINYKSIYKELKMVKGNVTLTR
jgi:gliding motility-associated-like protein